MSLKTAAGSRAGRMAFAILLPLRQDLVLSDHDQTVSSGNQLVAAPISTLWG